MLYQNKSRLPRYMEAVHWVLTILSFSASHLWKDLFGCMISIIFNILGGKVCKLPMLAKLPVLI